MPRLGNGQDNSNPWYLHPIYNRYWKHYHETQQWFGQLMNFHRSRIERINPRQYSDSFRRHSGPKDHVTTKDSKTRHSYDHISEKKTEEELSKSENEFVEDEESMPEDLKEFLKVSADFRKKRDAEKKKLQQQEKETELIDATTIINGRIPYGVLPNTQMKYLEKKKLLTHLYGSQSHRISGLNASLECTFIEHMNTKRPVVWPIMPLKLDIAKWQDESAKGLP